MSSTSQKHPGDTPVEARPPKYLNSSKEKEDPEAQEVISSPKRTRFWILRLGACLFVACLWLLHHKLVVHRKLGERKSHDSAGSPKLAHIACASKGQGIRHHPTSGAYTLHNSPKPPAGLTLNGCTNWSKATGETARSLDYAMANFSGFSVDSGLIFVSTGDSHGHLRVSQAIDGSTRNGEAQVTVHIMDKAQYRSYLDVVKVCKISRGDGSVGVGIFSPKIDGSDAGAPIIQVYVQLPPPVEASKVLEVPLLEIDMPLFSQSLGFSAMERKVSFQSLRLKAAERDVRADHITADNLAISTVNGRIEGSFDVYSSLAVETETGAIDTSLGLHNIGTDRATRVDMRSTKGSVRMEAWLMSRPQFPSGRNYSVTLAAAKGNVMAHVTDTEGTAALRLDVAGGIVDTRLRTGFHGNFHVLPTETVSSTLIPRVYTQAPSDQHQIVAEYSKDNLTVEGLVSWPGMRGSSSSVNIQYSESAHLGLWY
ncbi:hypothetical protein FA15DRAFT_675601 [Coprinopsis marcescibilis]|uniref:Uncharacterized protein n=1 Tax=Coprinopsis marcescibilis TaxID=230819 RepID=A0A5C3KDD5_COPMA|nr:hypothetical protein FA15DRAFT_675601 [Coprinopsis marcescibilis]